MSDDREEHMGGHSLTRMCRSTRNTAKIKVTDVIDIAMASAFKVHSNLIRPPVMPDVDQRNGEEVFKCRKN